MTQNMTQKRLEMAVNFASDMMWYHQVPKFDNTEKLELQSTLDNLPNVILTVVNQMKTHGIFCTIAVTDLTIAYNAASTFTFLTMSNLAPKIRPYTPGKEYILDNVELIKVGSSCKTEGVVPHPPETFGPDFKFTLEGKDFKILTIPQIYMA